MAIIIMAIPESVVTAHAGASCAPNLCRVLFTAFSRDRLKPLSASAAQQVKEDDFAHRAGRARTFELDSCRLGEVRLQAHWRGLPVHGLSVRAAAADSSTNDERRGPCLQKSFVLWLLCS